MVLKDMVELLSIDVGCDRAAAGTVRAAFGRFEHLGWIAGDAMLVASELVTNVVTRAGIDPHRRVAVHITETADSLTVAACDSEGSRPRGGPGDERPSAEPGLGFLVVDALARQWGTDHEGGYRVWAELAKHPAA